MTLQQFNNTRFGAGMRCIYKGQTRDIGSVEFEEKLLGLVNEWDDEELNWVRCENIELIR